MDYADAIRRQAEDAPRAALPAVTALMWKAFADGQITEAEAEALSVLIEARATASVSSQHPAVGHASNPSRTSLAVTGEIPSDRPRSPKSSVGSRPRTDASIERRRRWAAAGRLPPAIAARFTLAEHAVLACVGAETARRGDCRLAVGHIASIVGVAETTVRNAIREARKLGLLTVEERRLTGYRNDTNVVRIVSTEWTAWLRLARKGVAFRDPLGREVVKRHPISAGGGCKSPNRTPTQVLKQGKPRPAEALQGRIARAGKPS